MLASALNASGPTAAGALVTTTSTTPTPSDANVGKRAAMGASNTAGGTIKPSPTATSADTLVDDERKKDETFPQFATFMADAAGFAAGGGQNQSSRVTPQLIQRKGSWRTSKVKPISRGTAVQTDAIPTQPNHVQQRTKSTPIGIKKKQSKCAHTDDAKGVEEVPLFTLLATYFGYVVLILFGHLRDFFGKRFKKGDYEHLLYRDGKAPLTSDFESFYRRRLYFRIRDVFNRPFTGVPGRHISVLDRFSNDQNLTFQHTGKVHNCLNLSSYNYLGFAENEGPCAEAVESCITSNGVSMQSPPNEVGTSELHVKLEKLVTTFLGVDSAMLISMGHATNTTTIPALVGKGSLIISDELNHNSLVMGSRMSGAAIRVFKHNDPKHLEKVLREAIVNGQPRSCRPWKKILVVVEGLYSMEGNFCCLPEIIALKHKYKFYLFLDEAHSIGAIGPRGRGVCEHFGVDPKEVDVMMGTFTKSFGASGGYIGGRRDLIAHLKNHSHAPVYAEGMSIPVLQQVHSSLKQIMDEPTGQQRISQLRSNSRYFHRKLREMGFVIYGHPDSPVIPLLLFSPAKIAAFSREMLKNDIAVVVVGYPATPIITGRVRFCVSAAHSKEDLERALEVISEVGDRLMLKVLPRKQIEPGKMDGMPVGVKDNCIKQPGMTLGLQERYDQWSEQSMQQHGIVSMLVPHTEGKSGHLAVQSRGMNAMGHSMQPSPHHPHQQQQQQQSQPTTSTKCRRDVQKDVRWWSFLKPPHGVTVQGHTVSVAS